jgi:outer membrane protein OmpA-like peptidoglycan-associated protein
LGINPLPGTNKILLFLTLAVFFSAPFLGAQTAAETDLILETQEVSAAQASRFVLAAAGALDAGSGDAYALAGERGWLPQNAAEDSPLALGELSFLIMKAFGLQGSFLYALFPGPRYAYRELDYRGLIPAPKDPGSTVSGERLLIILGRILNYTGEAPPEWEAPAEAAEEAPPEWEAPAEAPEEAPAETAGGEVQAVRETLAGEIRVELEERGVADTSVRVAEAGVTIALSNIQFMADSAELTVAEREKVANLGAILSRFPKRKIVVEGHTALAGNEEGRLRMSLERAQAVADFLVYLEVRRQEDMVVRGYGAERPVADNATAGGQAMNRRVEITLLDEE